MFDPEKVKERLGILHSRIQKWELFEHNGVYYTMNEDGNVKYFLVNKRYNHKIAEMREMLEAKLKTANIRSNMAWDLLFDIKIQLEHELSKRVRKLF